MSETAQLDLCPLCRCAWGWHYTTCPTVQPKGDWNPLPFANLVEQITTLNQNVDKYAPQLIAQIERALPLVETLNSLLSKLPFRGDPYTSERT